MRIKKISSFIANKVAQLLEKSTWATDLNHQVITLQDNFEDLKQEVDRNGVDEEKIWDIEDDIEHLKDEMSNKLDEDDVVRQIEYWSQSSNVVFQSDLNEVENSLRLELGELEERIVGHRNTYEDEVDHVLDELLCSVKKLRVSAELQETGLSALIQILVKKGILSNEEAPGGNNGENNNEKSE